MRQIQVRRFTGKGSETETLALAEAIQVAEQAWKRGALVVDEDKEEAIQGIGPDVQRILIVNPIAGG